MIMIVALALALGLALVPVYAKPAVTVPIPEDAVLTAEDQVIVGESVVKLKSDESSPIADEIVRIYNAQPQPGDEGSHVTVVTVGSNSKPALVSISVHEDGVVRLSVYHDYKLDGERACAGCR